MAEELRKFDEERLLILIFIYSGLLVLIVSILRARSWYLNRVLQSIPRGFMPIRRSELPRGIHSVVVDNLDASRATKESFTPESKEQFGWGAANTEFSNVHFKTSIAKSHVVLERAAMFKDPALRRKPQHTVREYVEFLRSTAGLNARLCQRYLSAYERARFGTHLFTLRDYREFMTHFLALIQHFEYY